MERLNNKEILIGREPEMGRLMVAITINGQHKSAVLGEFKSVPDGVSRCKPSEGRAHCKLAIDDNGRMVVTNLNMANYTYVNNHEITIKSVTADAQLQLGAVKFPVSLASVVNVAKGLLPEIPKEYSIKHLEKVWEEYDKRTKKERKINNLFNSVRGLLTLFAILMGSLGDGVVRNILYVVAVIMALFLFYDLLVGRSDKKRDERQIDFEGKYVCPGCNKYLNGGNFQPYRRLQENTSCPYCRCKWTDK